MPEVVITRKKDIRSKAPRKEDLHAWKHNGAPEPEPVVRSPEDPDKWLCLGEWNLLLERLSHEDTPFTSRKSKRPVLRPKPGYHGWFRPRNPRKISRDRFKFTSRSWIPDPEVRFAELERFGR